MCSSSFRLISVAGFLDSIVAAKQNGAKYGHPISPNRELVALGAANMVGSFFPGTLPAYGSITRLVQLDYPSRSTPPAHRHLQVANQWRCGSANADVNDHFLDSDSYRDILPPSMDLLPSPLRARRCVSVASVFRSWRSNSLVNRILLVVYSLIAETPHDVLYYWRYVTGRLLLL